MAINEYGGLPDGGSLRRREGASEVIISEPEPPRRTSRHGDDAYTEIVTGAHMQKNLHKLAACWTHSASHQLREPRENGIHLASPGVHTPRRAENELSGSIIALACYVAASGISCCAGSEI